ncbi:hypothetical protein B0H10DRAFT_2213411 [Mycena sp. CBHHK59/15]|nr:hypothetical protein B0H10DRAFT_2213411 [Mycena sp. CBHHK59/15]
MDFTFVPPEASGHSVPLSSNSAYKKYFKWSNCTPDTASGSRKAPLKQSTLASDIPLGKLKVSPTQLKQLEEIYRDHATTPKGETSPVDYLYGLSNDDQLTAAVIMAQQGLDIDARECMENHWSQQWSRYSSNSIKATGKTRRVLYLCRCAYDHTQAQKKERHTHVPFTSCLAHGEITYAVDSHKILRIRGYFHHNDTCKQAEFTRIPPTPVHPSVFVVSLSQLRDGASFADVKKKNRELFTAQSYKDFPADLRASPYRWLLETRDSRSLYRQFSRMNGVKVTDAPQINIDEWLDPTSPQYNPTIAQAVFHYSARANKGEHFEACVATEEMNAAAWKYGHENQIILDGTFGICDSRLLLFIVMVIDENRKGVPVAFLMFSAPTGNKQSSSGYNTDILTKVIQAWKEIVTKCGHRYGFPGVIFCPYTCITDTDLKERGALFTVFPQIWLLICRFHLRQSWKNHRNKLLKGKSRLKIDLKRRLKRLEDSLVKTQTIEDARSLLVQERELLTQLGDGKAIHKAVEHVDYLNDYWTTDNLWKSWSDFGRKVAASLLGCEMDGVIPTTNHLESFNGVLKRKHLRRWQNGGRCIRVDVLIQILIIHILPSIFQERRLYCEQVLRIAAQVRRLPGGENLLKTRSSGRQIIPKIAYLLPDVQRDERARDLLTAGQIGVPAFVPDPNTLVFTCYSSQALEIERAPIQYTISVGFDGVVTCTCPDFEKHGGACKHIRGALFLLDNFRAQGINMPTIPIPLSLTDAHALQTKTVIDRADAPSGESPMVRTAAAISDLLQADESCVEFSLEGNLKCRGSAVTFPF